MIDKKRSPYETLTALITVLAIAYWFTDIKVLLIFSIVVGLMGSLFKTLACLIHQAWLHIAKGINFLISNLLLGLIFFLILTPIAFFYRLLNKKQLMTSKPEDSFYHDVNRDYQAEDLKNPW